MKALLAIFALIASLGVCQARNLTFAWDASPGTNVAAYRLQWAGTNLVTTNLTATVTNFPCGSNVVVTIVAIAKAGIDSDPSDPVSVFVNCPPQNFRYSAMLESTDDLGAPFQTVESLGSFVVSATEPKRFHRVRIVRDL